MKFDRVNKTTAHIYEIPDVLKVREELKARGTFSPDYSQFTISQSGFKVTTHTDWGLHGVVVRIKSKPFFVNESTIFDMLKAEVDEMSKAT